MTCAELEDRVFDEDCRAALSDGGEVPLDVAEHLARCPGCGAQWSQAAGDARRLSRQLLIAPPPAVRGRLYEAFRSAARPRSRTLDVEALFHVVAVGALGACLAGVVVAGLPDWAGFCLGASLGLGFTGTHRAGRALRAPWALARRAASQCLEQLLRPV